MNSVDDTESGDTSRKLVKPSSTDQAISAQTDPDTLLSVRNLKVYFPAPRKHVFSKASNVHAVDDVSFDVKKGTTCALVGESGSGKTTTALATMRLTPITSGEVWMHDTPVHALQGEALRQQRAAMQIIFQDPYSSLNPRLRAGDIVRSPLQQLGNEVDKNHDDRVAELFALVGLRPEQQALFPHQFSGGQRQRVGIARALATQPGLIVCDEPVSALDVAIQAQILNLLRRLQSEFSLTYLFISHDLGVVQYMCDEVAVMYLGQIVEYADRRSLFSNALHPYTQALLSAVPSADPALRARTTRIQIVGEPPSPIDPQPGCRFASRCSYTIDRCRVETPMLRVISAQHKVACHRVDDDGGKTNVSAIPAASSLIRR